MPDALTAAITDVHAELDEIAEDNQEKYRARLYDLLTRPEERNLIMWRNRNVDQYLYRMTIEDVERKNGGQRDDIWRNEFAGLMAACEYQAYIEIIARPVAEAMQQAEKIQKAASSLNSKQLKAYAKTGPKKSDFEAAKERRRNGKAIKTTDKQSA